MLNGLDICMQAVGFLIQTLPVAILCFVPFSGEALRMGWAKTAAAVCAALVLVSVLFAGMTVLLYARVDLRDGELQMCANCYMMLVLSAGILFFFWNVRAPGGRKLLVILLLVHYAAVLFTMTSYLIGFVSEKGLNARTQQVMYDAYVCLISFVLMAITAPLVYAFLRGRVRRSLPAMEEDVMQRGCGYLAVAMALYCGVVYVLKETEFPEGFQGLTVLWVLGALLLTDCLVYFMFFTEIELVSRNRKLERQLRDFDEEYRRISSSIEESRRARHDIRHHLNMIGMFNERGDYQGLTDYLAGYEAVYRSQEERKFCGYPVIDAILGYYVRLAEENGVRVKTELDTLKESMAFDVIDLVVLLGNVMENAVEACLRPDTAENPYIRVCMRRKGELLLILVENSCEKGGEGWREFQDGLPRVSSKHAGVGQGLKSARIAAEKYAGSLEYRRWDGVFGTRIVLREPLEGRED